jgi:TatD DNase family protein
VSLAKELNLPVIIHVREAFDEVFAVIDKLNDSNLKGVFHSFSGNSAQAEKIVEYGGFKLGINGIVTYKKSDLPEIIKKTGIQHLVLETDSPWLPPVPHRGKRNETAFMIHTADKTAEIFGLTRDELAEIIVKNTLEIFTTILE